VHARTASRRHRPPQPCRRDPAPLRAGASCRCPTSVARAGDADLACVPEPRLVHVLALVLALATGHRGQPQPHRRRLCDHRRAGRGFNLAAPVFLFKAAPFLALANCKDPTDLTVGRVGQPLSTLVGDELVLDRRSSGALRRAPRGRTQKPKGFPLCTRQPTRSFGCRRSTGSGAAGQSPPLARPCPHQNAPQWISSGSRAPRLVDSRVGCSRA
jgi:hypothetical protein